MRAPKACYKVNQLVLVNLEIMDKYLETFHIVEDCIDETIILKRVLTTERSAIQ
nr:DUF6462 family protein [Roseburia lenta]